TFAISVHLCEVCALSRSHFVTELGFRIFLTKSQFMRHTYSPSLFVDISRLYCSLDSWSYLGMITASNMAAICHGESSGDCHSLSVPSISFRCGLCYYRTESR